MPFMRLLFFLGWLLMFLAFVGAAGEAIPRSLPGGAVGSGWFVSAYDLWYAAQPGSLVVTQIQVEKLSPVLWDPVIVALLALPAWLLFGLPGVLLTWFCRPHREITAEQREDLQKQEESLLLFDKLTEEARAAGFDDGEDDRAPSHVGQGIIDVTDRGGDPVFPEIPFAPDPDWDGGGAGDGEEDGEGDGDGDGDGGGDGGGEEEGR